MKYIYLILLALLALVPATSAQTGNITVNGKVIEENGEALPGAAIMEKGTDNATITDLDGNFSLSVSSDATLAISFIGFKSIEVPVDGKTDIGTITLVADMIGLDQVVVIGYGTQKKVDLTGSVAIVDAEEMKKVSHSNISTMLEGKVAGVQITSDGQPGADPAVRIRGISTFGDSNPLYVIDGVPMGTTIRDFSPNDIETIQVLKDASAAAIYGSRAANGVVIITTKQGKKNQAMKIDYSGYFGFDQVEKGVYDVMDANQYKDFATNAFTNSGIDTPNGYNPNSTDYLYDADGGANVNTNWFDEVFKTGVRQNHNINLSGGGEHNTYNIGLDYYSQEGTMVGAGPNLDRYTARLNNTMEVKFLKIQTSLVYSHSDQDNMALSNANEYVEGLYGTQYPVMASALLLPPTIKAYDESTWVLDDRISAASNYTYDAHGFGTYYDNVHGQLRMTNVLMTNSLLERNSKVDRIVGSGSVNVDFLDMFGKKSKNHKLNYRLNLSYSRTMVKDFTWIPAFISSNNNYLAKEDETLTQAQRNYSSTLIENIMTYDGTVGLHHINVIAGQTFERGTTHEHVGTAINMPEPYFLQLDNAEDRKASSFESEHVLASYIGRINYSFDDKYLLSATVRRDGSSRFSSDHRWGWFPSVSAGWRIERESFFPLEESLVGLLKIRGSYGELGNENIAPQGNPLTSEYLYKDGMTRGNYTYSFGGTKVTGSSISNYVNTELMWETKKTIDIGLDLAMFNNKLEFTFDWYQSTSEDLLYEVNIPANAGVTNGTVVVNTATMVNSGLEFLLAYHTQFKDVKFDISANVATLENEVTKLGFSGEPKTDGFCRTELGSEVGQFYGYVLEDDDGVNIINGIAQNSTIIDSRTNENGDFITQNGAEAGDLLYKDLDNDGEITAEDRTILGSGLPDVSFGLNIRAEWKGFDLNISTYGAAGFKAVDFVDMTLRGSYGATNKSVDLLNAWTPAWTTMGTTTDVPRVQYSSDILSNDYFSDRYIQDASYLKIANIELGYNFPDSWFKGYVKGVRIYASGQNLYTFSKYKGYNVDFAGGVFTPGYNYCSYPTPRTVMFGAHLSF